MEATAISESAASLAWSPGDSAPVDRYYIRYSNIDDPLDTEDGYSSIPEYVFSGLQPGATYSFNVAAQNADGFSPESETAYVTLQSTPTEPERK